MERSIFDENRSFEDPSLFPLLLPSRLKENRPKCGDHTARRLRFRLAIQPTPLQDCSQSGRDVVDRKEDSK